VELCTCGHKIDIHDDRAIRACDGSAPPKGWGWSSHCPCQGYTPAKTPRQKTSRP